MSVSQELEIDFVAVVRVFKVVACVVGDDDAGGVVFRQLQGCFEVSMHVHVLRQEPGACGFVNGDLDGAVVLVRNDI